jgi:hypothetical protein
MPDLGNGSVFSQTDASNNSGTMPSWSGSAAPSTLDDAGRAFQGAVTREWNWRSYTLTATGTADAKVLTFSVAPAAYYNGQRFSFIANTTNTTTATLNVNSLGAKSIRKMIAGTATVLAAGDMVAGAYVEVAYNTSGDYFVWLNRGLSSFPAGSASAPSIIPDGDTNTGFWFPAADTVAASTAGSERMRIDSTGNVGIGTTPSYPLDVRAATGQVNVQSTTGTNYARQLIQNTGGLFQFAIDSSTAAIFSNGGYSRVIYSDGAYPLITYTNGVERMRIDASGDVGINQTPDANARFQVQETTLATRRVAEFYLNVVSSTATPAARFCKKDNDSTTSNKFIEFVINNNGIGCGQINANGASQAAFGSFSDYRLKENIVDLPPQLDKLMSLRPVEFDYKNGSGHQIGFIAQEMQEVYPDAVGQDGEYLTLTEYGRTEARLIKALQEAVNKIDALEARIAALESA